jgi:hypothetical protein
VVEVVSFANRPLVAAQRPEATARWIQLVGMVGVGDLESSEYEVRGS